ncbi:MAG: hypothetical protein AAB403_03250 [Planctomycetota bacterium]
MRTPLFQIQNIVTACQRKKVLTKKELLQAAGCSTMTAWRLLRPQGYFTSYNHNARYYTLVGIPQFDTHGLWAYRKIRFSKWGTLTKTIVGVIEDSAAGMTAEQLQQLLQLKNVKPTLTRLIQENRLTREKISGRLVYFPVPEAARRKQQQERRKDPAPGSVARPLPPREQIIALLVEIIQRPRNTPRQWVRRLARRGVRIGTKEIQAVLDHYRLDRKKGLLSS